MTRRQLDWGDYIAAVWKWRWRLFAALLASGAGAWTLSARMPKLFQATAVILPRESRTVGDRELGANAFLGLAPSSPTRDTFLAILRSRTLARELVREYGLAGGSRGGAEEDAIDALGARIGIDVSREGTIEITLKAETPELASAMANFYAESADRTYGALRMGEGWRRRAELEVELHELTRMMRSAEASRQRWQEVSGVYDVSEYLRGVLREEETLDPEIFPTGESSFIRTSRSRRSLLLSGQRFPTGQSLSVRKEIRKMLLGEEPEIRAQTTGKQAWWIRSWLREELGQGELLRESLRASRTDEDPEVVRLKRRLRGLARKIEEVDYGSGEGELGGPRVARPHLHDPLVPLGWIPALDFDAAPLNRDVNLSVKLANDIQARLAAARIQESMDLPTSFVLDRAEPEARPIWPRPLRNLIVATLGALFGGIYIALVAAYVSRDIQGANNRRCDHPAGSGILPPSK